MGEMASALRMLSGRFPTCVQRVVPAWKGHESPRMGQFFFVGSVPKQYSDGDARFFRTEDEAVQAAIDCGAERIQRSDCSFVTIGKCLTCAALIDVDDRTYCETCRAEACAESRAER